MSKAQEFLKKVAEDKVLQEKMTAIIEGKPEEISDKVVALAKENGFEITFDEFLKEGKEQEGEVSDDELDKVAGGGYKDEFKLSVWLAGAAKAAKGAIAALGE